MLKDISGTVEKAFEAIGLDKDLARISPSKRADLSDFQCNGALQVAKILKCPPREIAEQVKDKLNDNPIFSSISVDGPGFLNFRLSDNFILGSLVELSDNDYMYNTENPEKYVIDYGGPNVAKPLHVGHLRSAIIGESIKRTGRMLGHTMIGDIHMGDWGTPMGMLIAELEESNPDWSYFRDNYTENEGDNNSFPLTGEELNSLYPVAAKKFKDDEDFKARSRKATSKLQDGHAGYRALWRHFVNLSIENIKKDFAYLDVDFDLWLGESDSDPYIETITEEMRSRGLLRESEGAVVVDVAQESDNYDLPPMIIKKTDGAATYAATDLATIFQRVQDFSPDHILYVVDQRQSDHFRQVFRTASKAGYIAEDNLEHVGFGTMNGTDGKPYKTRAGGVMRLSDLIKLALSLAQEVSGFSEEDIKDINQAQMIQDVAMGAIKYGDLRNPRTSDYVFDPNQLVAFEGNTGPYVQYASVRAKAIIDKAEQNITVNPDLPFFSKTERNLALKLIQYPNALETAFNKRQPSDLCGYVYDLSRAFSSFYTDCAILFEKNIELRNQRLALTNATYRTINNVLHALAIPSPKKMLRASADTSPNL